MTNALANFGPLAAMGYVQEQGELGRKRGQQNQLNQLASLSYSATTPQQQNNLLGQMAQIDPAAAQSQQKAFVSDEDRRHKTLANMANLLVNAPEQARSGLYRQMVPSLKNFGMEVPDQYDASTAPVIDQTARALYQSYSGTAGQTPTDVRSFQLMTAGLSPEDRERARMINLGLEGRASNAGFGFFEFEGADRRKRMGRNNPRTGVREIYDETTGEFTPLGGASTGGQVGPAVVQPGGGQRAMDQDVALANQLIAAGIPEAQVDAFIASRASQASGTTQNWSSADGAASPAPVQAPRFAGNPDALVGGTPEAQAAAVEEAKRSVEMRFLPSELGVRNDAEIDRLRREAEAKAAAERAGKQAGRTTDATDTLDLLTQAESLLRNGATGGLLAAGGDLAAAVFNRSTQGAQATASLQTIAGQLTSKMPRMEGPQSNVDVKLYQQMAGDLSNDTLPVQTRIAALQQLRQLQQKYTSDEGPAGNANPSTRRTITRSGIYNGRRVIQYSDGSTEYGD